MKLVNVPVVGSEFEVTINADQIILLRPDEKDGREVTRIVMPDEHVFLIDWTYGQTLEALKR